MRNTMLIGLSLTCLFFSHTTGCQSEPERPIGDADYVAPRPSALKFVKLEDLPPTVSSTFLREYPQASVSEVETMVASNGESVYKIVFIQSNDAKEVWYDADGKPVRRPDRPGDAR